jgi:hypothetical protein
LGGLALNEAVPAISSLRYTKTGLRKHAVWVKTWDLQRAGDSCGESTAGEGGEVAANCTSHPIPVPPKLKASDFHNGAYWRLRGKLDVPKERFISLPHCERDADPSLVIGWAGWNHLEQAQAIAAYYIEMKEHEGWAPERLTPLLTAIRELVPWVRQWHNDRDPETGVCMGDYMDDFVNMEARELGLTLEQMEEWTPPRTPRKRRG